MFYLQEWIPDVLVIISTDHYRIPEININETLLHAVSPIHAFFVHIGNGINSQQQTDYSATYQYTATTVHLSSIDFDHMDELQLSLCESIVSYVVVGAGTGTGTGAGW